MNDFIKCNKINGVYWLKNSIDALTIKIKTKPQDGVIQLPRFEDYNKPDTAEHESKETIDEVIFKWQQKIFSRHEIEKYSNVHNCITDTELEYFEHLEQTRQEGNKIFTYVNGDYYRPLPINSQKEKQSNIPFLNTCFAKLNLKDDTVGRVFNDRSSSTTHLFKSKEEISFETDHWMAMHIVYDSSEYNENSELMFKKESTLLSLYYNATKKCLILSPDANDLAFNPYTIEGDRNGPQYAIEICYTDENDGEELVKLLNKLYKKWEKKQKQAVNFSRPPLGKSRVYMAFEIVSAKDFETNNFNKIILTNKIK